MRIVAVGLIFAEICGVLKFAYVMVTARRTGKIRVFAYRHCACFGVVSNRKAVTERTRRFFKQSYQQRVICVGKFRKTEVGGNIKYSFQQRNQQKHCHYIENSAQTRHTCVAGISQPTEFCGYTVENKVEQRYDQNTRYRYLQRRYQVTQSVFVAFFAEHHNRYRRKSQKQADQRFQLSYRRFENVVRDKKYQQLRYIDVSGDFNAHQLRQNKYAHCQRRKTVIDFYRKMHNHVTDDEHRVYRTHFSYAVFLFAFRLKKEYDEKNKKHGDKSAVRRYRYPLPILIRVFQHCKQQKNQHDDISHYRQQGTLQFLFRIYFCFHLYSFVFLVSIRFFAPLVSLYYCLNERMTNDVFFSQRGNRYSLDILKNTDSLA